MELLRKGELIPLSAFLRGENRRKRVNFRFPSVGAGYIRPETLRDRAEQKKTQDVADLHRYAV